jgi:HEAT repeat protein
VVEMIEVARPGLELALRGLRDPVAGVRSASARALGAMSDVRVVGPLVAALSDPDVTVRDTVAIALAAIGLPAVDSLLTALQAPDSNVVVSAASVLVRIGDGRAARPLVTALLDPDARSEVLNNLLAQTRDTALIEFPIAAMQARESSVRANAAKALGRMKARRAVEPLVQAIGHGGEGVRSAAASALAEIGDLRAIEPLVSTLSDPNTGIVKTVAGGLVGMGAPAVAAILRRLDSDSASCAWLRITLAACGHAESEDYVVRRMCEGGYAPKLRHELLGFSDSDAFRRVLAGIERGAADPGMRLAAQVFLAGAGAFEWERVKERAARDSSLFDPTMEAFE